MGWVRGSKLSGKLQREVLSAFVHRFTGNHKPAWSRQEWRDGLPYPLQFASDQEWLENTQFAVTCKDTLDRRVDFCFSSPTWPENPELRIREAA
jgi:hypothetical protein